MQKRRPALVVTSTEYN
nr:hypothetical protein [Lentilactobacillus sunkii]